MYNRDPQAERVARLDAILTEDLSEATSLVMNAQVALMNNPSQPLSRGVRTELSQAAVTLVNTANDLLQLAEAGELDMQNMLRFMQLDPAEFVNLPVTMRRSKVCLVEGCGRRHLARGMCNVHYKRWYIHGDPYHARSADRTCSVEGCVRTVSAKKCASSITDNNSAPP